MSLLRNIASGLRSLLRKEQFDRELDEELRAYQEMAAEEKMKDGLSRQEALRAVRLERGSLEVSREIVRSGSWESVVDTLWGDFLFAFRLLRKNPGSTAAVVIALALGIGLNTTVFTFVNALLLRPPTGVKAPEQLQEVWIHNPRDSGAQGYLPLSYPDYVYYRDHNQSFEEMLAYDFEPHLVIWNKSGDGQTVFGQIVSGNFFSSLGVNAVLGRTISAEDDQTANPQPVVVLGDAVVRAIQHEGFRLPIDWRVLVFTLIVSLICGIAFGLTPALRSASAPVASNLKDETQPAGLRKSRLRSLLIIGEVATCTVLLVCATLCVRSLRNASSINPGFNTRHVIAATLDPGSLGYSEAQVRTFYEQLSEHVRAFPGVTAASFTDHRPLDLRASTLSSIQCTPSQTKTMGYQSTYCGLRPTTFRLWVFRCCEVATLFLPRASKEAVWQSSMRPWPNGSGKTKIHWANE